MFRTLTPIFSILAAIAIFFFFTKPMFSEIEALRAETDEYREAAQNAVQFNQKLTELVQRKNSYSVRQIERLEALVPDSVDEVKLLVDLEEMARAHGMLFGNVEVNSSDDDRSGDSGNQGRLSLEEDFISTDITFGLIGTYDQFRNLLRDIESSLVLMEITNIDFSASNSSLQQYTMTVRLHALASSNE